MKLVGGLIKQMTSVVFGVRVLLTEKEEEGEKEKEMKAAHIGRRHFESN